MAHQATSSPSEVHHRLSLDTPTWSLWVGCLGVVYGDIGTSPLYAFKEALAAAKGAGQAGPDVVIGIVSLALWTLMLIVTFKYVLLLLWADNRGEGGIFALATLAQKSAPRFSSTILLLGTAGAAFFYGDCVITPAISVLSAVEGLDLVSPAFSKLVLPISAVIIVVLFAVQAHGTAKVGIWFGPIMVVWFVLLGAGGLSHIADDPMILSAINPWRGLSFLYQNGFAAILVLGAVFLTVTGAEALYADLGHFGRNPVRQAWLALVFPALVLNYLGQGALVLGDPSAADSPFFRLYPSWALVPMVIMATLATVIASQAVITGAYSMTQQAVQLGLLPRLAIRHTSDRVAGQIYMPRINILMLAGVLLVIAIFKSSSALASAYGIAVTATMVLTTLMAFVVIWRLWHWPLWRALVLIVPLLLLELTFFVANSAKVLEGGWLPLMLAAALIAIMTTWQKGTALLARQSSATELRWLVGKLESKPVHRVSGTAVFLTANPELAPTSLLHNLKHNAIMHERNIVLSLETAQTPRVGRSESIEIERVSDHFITIVARHGFMQTPNIPAVLEQCRRKGVNVELGQTSFFLSRVRLKPTSRSELPRWQEKLFIGLAMSSEDATSYFDIPTNRVVEVGTQVGI